MAAIPATCGAAIDVPLNETPLLPVPELADTIEKPGAARSGLNPEPKCAGPLDVKSARESASSGLGITIVESSVTLTVSPASSASRMSRPSASVMNTAGMTGESTDPPMTNGGPVELSNTTKPVAPAACAFRYLSTNGHVPRCMNAMLPATSPALVSGVQPISGSAMTRSPVSGPTSERGAEKAASLDSMMPTSPAGLLIVVAPTVTPPSMDAATEMAFSATPGEPVT